MGTDRRGFLQIAGLAGLGLVIAKPVTDLFSSLHSSGTNTDSNALSRTANSAAGNATQWAMAIDIIKCKEGIDGGCNTVCQTACHQWHNVPDVIKYGGEREEEIKWIWRDTYGRVFEEHLIEHVDEEDEVKKALPVMLLCNQCTHPPCIRYCPTRATWKRDQDGIIMVDFHRCIGCRYCMAGCPYGARSFNWRSPRYYLEKGMEKGEVELNPEFPTRVRGVVEKCNFCADRLDKVDDDGNRLQPRCVEVCPSHALTFGNLLDKTGHVYELLREHHVLRRLPELGTYPNNYYIFSEE